MARLTKTCDTWCTACEYLNQWGPVFCDYIGLTGRRRPCPAGKGCTERRRPERLRRQPRDPRLEALEADMLARQAAEEKARKAREKAQEKLREAAAAQPERKIHPPHANRRPPRPGLEAQARALWDWRNKLGIQQKDVAEMLDVNRNTYQKWENGAVAANWRLLAKVGCYRPL